MILSGLLTTLARWVGLAPAVRCEPLPELSDPAGREMREFLTEFRIDGRTFGDSVIAYDLADAERLVADMRNSLRVVGELEERGRL